MQIVCSNKMEKRLRSSPMARVIDIGYIGLRGQKVTRDKEREVYVY